MGKVFTKYAPQTAPDFSATEPLLIRQSVAHMNNDQFATYESALRQIDYYNLSPDEQQRYLIALQAVNERRQQQGFNVTIRDGNQASALPSLPGGLQWTPLLAIAGVLVIAALMGRR